VANLTASFFGRAAARPVLPTTPTQSPTAAAAAALAPDAEREAQHAILRDAIRDLSQGLAKPLHLSPTTTLRKWDAIFRTTTSEAGAVQLSTSQLEELGRAYYEGSAETAIASGKSGGGGGSGGAGDRGIPRDERLAMDAWRAAASRGSVEAAYSLAVCIREGRGCSKDPIDARKRMRALAEGQNYHLAHYALAIMLTNGEGAADGQPDFAAAFVHFKAAAKAGVLPALHNIANAYAAGRGVKQSDHNALLYYQAAADAGDPHGMFSLASWLHTGRGSADGTKQPEKAFKWNLEAAHKGHPAAMFNIGAAFMSGVGTGSQGRDYIKAAGWFEKASYEGSGRLVEASINLGNMYRQGLGVSKDRTRAKQIFMRCAPFNKVCAKLVDEIVSEEQREANA